MGVKMIAALLAVSLASISHALNCYTCEVGLAETDHACLDPSNPDLEPAIKEVECTGQQDVCATVVYPNNLKRYCGVGMVDGQPLCNRINGEYDSCTACPSDLCNSDKTGGAATMAMSTALIVTFAAFLFVLQ